MKANKDKILSSNAFPVVGIGASAGGLDAFKKLLKAIPENSGMAYVLVQHLDPSHESMLPDLLQKVTNIPVLEISDDIKVEPDHIYIIPSNKMLLANDGVLLLSQRPAPNKNKRNLPIDLFFTSLAEVHQTHSIGVVLSGTASDGTLGLKAIKDHGGITFAQDETSAAYDDMPRSAVQAGVVDFILPPEKIPEKLLEVTNSINQNGVDVKNIPQHVDDVFNQILLLLRIRTGTDFTYYKQTTIRRRILRRMALNKNEEPSGYLKYLRDNRSEQDVLYQDLLIPVTAFFRDHKSFDNLCEKVFPLIVKNKKNGEPIRIWVAGCSTGEEAYSIAICFKEFLVQKQEKVQIFATDISEPAITKARTGIYTESEVEGLTPQRLQKFFTKTNGSYHVSKQLRDTCVFALHDFLKDPPFSKIDFISCRNVLIYMEPYLQKKALTAFHYSLNPKRLLLLGKSETTSGVSDLFTSADKSDKLFSRKDVPGRFMEVTSQGTEQSFIDQNTNSKSENVRTDFQKTADHIILSKYTPAGVVVNEAMDIVHFRGSTSAYLEQSPGQPSHNLLKMAKNGLAFELRNILYKAKKEKASVLKENIPLQVNNSRLIIAIEAIPLPNIVEPHYLILFHDNNSIDNNPSTKSNKKTTSGEIKNNEKDLSIQQLEQELAQTREDMRGITEDQEAANEELQSANEELQSSSEELQSLNEELETNREELQSTNEELTVVNQELIGLNEQVTEERNYSQAIVGTIREPLVVLDKNLRVKTANSNFYKKFQVNERESEGRLIYDLGNKQWNIPELRTLLEAILPEKEIFFDVEINHNFESIGQRTMLLNASEIIRESSAEKLILLAIEDITEQVIARKKDVENHELRARELEEKVQQRTLELRVANESLQQKNQELANMNKELESFAYISSHDLQEPLRKIQTFASRILEKEHAVLSDKGKDYFHIMQDSARRMQTLIHDLIAYSRVNITERKFEKTDLNSIIEDVKTDLKETIEEKQAVIEIHELCEANINIFQFRQMMYNLIGNSLKFSRREKPPHIIIKSEIYKSSKLQNEEPALPTGQAGKLSPEKNYCHITISDNGIGFEPQYKDKIFEVFQRLYSKDEYSGTGIGLSIVKRIVENHNGIITASGELNKGATFDIYIPA